jgi:amylosucrase
MISGGAEALQLFLRSHFADKVWAMQALTGVDTLVERVLVSAALGENLAKRLNLAGYDETARHLFVLRLRAALQDSVPALRSLYPTAALEPLLAQFAGVAANGAVARKAALRRRDVERLVDPLWFQAPDAVGYVAYAEQFGPTLGDVAKRADYLNELGVKYFHLMNVIKARPEPNDGGFAVQDYRSISEERGTIDDLETLADTMRDRNVSLCIDLVMNHTAAEHSWAVAARAGDQKYRDYYLVYPDRTEPDAFERTLPEVFPEMAPGNFTWDADLNGWVWTTFNTYQWDLNYANPNVLLEMFDIMCFLGNRGIESLRLDAVAFTWKRLGTDCQNQPEAHLIVQVLRALMNAVAPTVLLKAEAIVGPRELTTYLGAHSNGVHQSEYAECQIAYHNQLMVNIWSALATRDAALMTQAMRSLPQTPGTAGWGTYVRCHDDIGWAIDDSDAAAVGLNGSDHRKFLASFFRGDFPGSFAHGVPFSSNAETGDERTCGSTAALTGISHARSTGDAAGVSYGIKRLLLAYSVAASFGMPLIYMGDELALGDDVSYLADPTRADDSRWRQRAAMDWKAAEKRLMANTVEESVFCGLRSMLKVRAATPQLHQGGLTYVLDVSERSVFAFAKRHPRHGVLMGLANVAEHPVNITRSAIDWAGLTGEVRNVLGDTARFVGGRIEIDPLSMAWFVSAP